MEKFFAYIVKFSLILMGIVAVGAVALGIGILRFPQMVTEIVLDVIGIIVLVIGIGLLLKIANIL